MLDPPMITCAIVDLARRAMAAEPRDRSRPCAGLETPTSRKAVNSFPLSLDDRREGHRRLPGRPAAFAIDATTSALISPRYVPAPPSRAASNGQTRSSLVAIDMTQPQTELRSSSAPTRRASTLRYALS